MGYNNKIWTTSYIHYSKYSKCKQKRNKYYIRIKKKKINNFFYYIFKSRIFYTTCLS